MPLVLAATAAGGKRGSSEASLVTQTGGQSIKRPGTTTGRRVTTVARRAPVPSQPSRALRFLGLTSKLVVILLFSLSVVASLAYVRLLQGPVTLRFLAEPIQDALSSEFSGVRLRIEDVAVRLADRFNLEFELKNVRVTGDRDETLALASAATISLSRAALLTGRIAPESVALISPRLLLYYGEDGNLSLKFSHPSEPIPGEPAARGPGRGPSAQAPNGGPAAQADPGLGRIDLIKVLSEASGRARRREAASAYLREIGLKSATVVIDNGARRSIWRVPELAIDLDHARASSSIAGRARMESLAGPWTLNFRTQETSDSNRLQLAVSVQGLVPRGLARTVPSLAVLEGIDMPVWGEAKLDLSSSGEILGGNIVVDAAPGELRLPWLAAAPLKVDGAHMEMSYDSARRRFDVGPSVLAWGDSRLQFTGVFAHSAQTSEGPGWNFSLKTAGSWLAAEPPATQRLNIDDWSAQGVLAPDRGRILLKQLSVRAGGATVSAEGDISDLGGATRTRFEGKLSPMSIKTFQALWPSMMAPLSRAWVARHLVRGQLQGGSFRLLSGSPVETSTGNADRASLTLEASNVAFNLVEGWPLLEAPRALARLDGQGFEMTVPDGFLAAADGRRVSVKGSFSVDTAAPMPRSGHIVLRSQGPLSLVHELFDRAPFRSERETAFAPDKIEGRVDAQLALALPLDHELKEGDLKPEGRVRILDGRLKPNFGNYDITSANVVIDMASTSADAKGEMLVNGVVAKVAWQHVFGAAPDKQPPLRITSVLDNSYRTQLGLDINDLVQGDVGIEVTVTKDAQSERHVHVRADLLNAELNIDSVAWRKPKGRPAVFDFDYAKGTGALPIELRNVKLVGDNVALEGWIGMGADNKVREFRFPTFSLNVVTSLETHGRMRNDGVWDVTAKGATYDGRELFRSFFDVGNVADTSQKHRPGLDLKAEIGTVIGHLDTNMRNVRVSLQKRGLKMISLDARGTLEGGKPFAAVLKPEPGKPRRLLAESQDAGLLYKLVGFYPNAVGGLMNLEVNLDGEGVAERTGTLWTRDFVVLGDPIISEVLQNADGSSASPGQGKRRVSREQFEFERMRIPFSIGHGQFVMHSAYINGPLIGATMRGKVDFRAQQLNVGGTYVPLSGLNRALAPIPLLGPLLTGPRGEGVLGITFAIQGPMSSPEVLVNPLSLVTPGIFREIMQMTPEDPKVLPRARPTPRPGEGPRASSAPPANVPGGNDAPRPAGELGGSWSAETHERRR